MANVIFKTGTKAQYDALATKDANTLYWLTDVLELRKGEALYGKGADATNLASGLMSAADKAKLDALSAGGTANLTAVDASVVITSGEDGSKIGVQLSKETGNALKLKADGLFVPEAPGAVEFSIEKQANAADGYSATYKLKRTEGDSVTYVGDEINLPKSMILQSGTLGTVTEANKPYAGAEVGDPYIDLVLSDASSTHIYVPVKGIVDPYTAGDGIKMEGNVISVNVNSANANGLAAGTGGLSLTTATSAAAGAMSAADKTALDTAVSDIANIKSSIVWGSLG